MFHTSNLKYPQRGHTYIFPTVISLKKMDTEYYLRQSIGAILSILNKPNNQLYF